MGHHRGHDLTFLQTHHHVFRNGKHRITRPILCQTKHRGAGCHHLPHFGIDPLFFGLLVALNLQTAFLSPPVAMAAFYLKGVSPPHVTLNQIFAGMMPFMAIQVFAIFLLYMFPAIGMWLPELLYK